MQVLFLVLKNDHCALIRTLMMMLLFIVHLKTLILAKMVLMGEGVPKLLSLYIFRIGIFPSKMVYLFVEIEYILKLLFTRLGKNF